MSQQKSSPNDAIFNGVAVQTNSVVSSSAIPMRFLDRFGIQLSFVVTDPAGLTGSVKLQGSFDKVSNLTNPDSQIANWGLLSGSAASILVPSGSGTQEHVVTWDNWQTVASWVRPVVTITAGTGSLSGRIASRG